MDAKRFLVWFAGATLAVLVLAAALNASVDPYSVFGSPRVGGLNASKTQASNFTGLVKAYQVERVAPRTVLLGTSRVDIAADPLHSAWPPDAAPVYNYGLPESSIANLERQLEHAMLGGRVNRVLVGIEFHDFLRVLPPTDSRSDIEERFDALATRRGQFSRQQQMAIDKAHATVSLRATIDSITTVARQRSSVAGDVSDQGLTSERPYEAVARSDGMHTLFGQKDRQLAFARHVAARRLAGVEPGNFVEIDRLKSFVDYCSKKGIELTLFIPPYHAHYLEIVDATGLWGRFEALKLV